jgi:hypothetical protein
MNVFIKIDYIASARVSQSGLFPLRGRTPEKVALKWWKYLKKETSYRATISTVLADGQDITQLVKDLEESEWENAMQDNLPF